MQLTPTSASELLASRETIGSRLPTVWISLLPTRQVDSRVVRTELLLGELLDAESSLKENGEIQSI